MGVKKQGRPLPEPSPLRLAELVQQGPVLGDRCRAWSSSSWAVRVTRALISRVLGSTQFRAPRYEAYLPMRVQVREGEEWLATTRDLSQGGLSLVSSRQVAPGRVVRIILRSPEGEWSSLATVVRTTPMPGADESLRTWHVGMRIDGHADVVGLRHILSAEALA